ncbi:hypothetical protein GJ496_000137 [Pomphorhynchus laevis]|nr:hypothetical protein GJ496_000137 [Pomphorhynchus laevis]
MLNTVSTFIDMDKEISDPENTVIDINSKEFKSALEKIAFIMRVPTKPDDTRSNLEAMYQVVSSRFGKNNINVTSLNPKLRTFKAELKSLAVGFNTSDEIVRNCAAIFRLLFINDMRHFQMKLNEILATIQEITGDPKTDSKLGKVGS